jgi:asparagine synthase (glutamine-hydrolysing)
MSGIFGIIHTDGAPIDQEELNAMHSAMLQWGPDAGATWRRDAAGLGCLITFDTPEAKYEQLPAESALGFTLTAEARLDNRDELCTELGIPGSERQTLADGRLLLLAHEKWGSDTPGHLLGDWSFAAWHPREKRLFLARDHSGNTALYYFQDARRFAFASSRKALFALGVPRRLNEFFLACVLISWTAHEGSQTIELDLSRLPPAHALSLQDGRTSVEQYWRLEDTPELRLGSSQEYSAGLLDILDRAVRDRLRSTAGIGLSLSGGLDSGSTAMLAARALRERGERLRGYTAVPTHDVSHATSDRSLGDEWPYAQSTAEAAGNVDLIPIRGEAMTPIQGIKATLAIHDEPGHAATNAFWIRELLNTARKDGVGVLLTGQGGNATISWNGANPANLVRTFIRAGLWKRAVQQLIYPHLPVGVIRALRQVRYRRGLDWRGSAINPDFARGLGLSAEYIRHTGDATKSELWYPPRRQRYAIIRPGASLIGSMWAENSGALGFDVRDPTLDKRVMEFSIAIPDREFRGPDGMDRWMIRAAMQGLLPDDVRLNRRLGRQAADVGHRLIETAAEVEATLAELEGSELARKYLNLGHVRRVWERLQREIGPDTTHATITILSRGIMTGLHLVGRERMA